jgi:hypothetical protein
MRVGFPLSGLIDRPDKSRKLDDPWRQQQRKSRGENKPKQHPDDHSASHVLGNLLIHGMPRTRRLPEGL